jgi:hypothetical protein
MMQSLIGRWGERTRLGLVYCSVNKIEAWAITIALLLVMLVIPARVYWLAIAALISLQYGTHIGTDRTITALDGCQTAISAVLGSASGTGPMEWLRSQLALPNRRRPELMRISQSNGRGSHQKPRPRRQAQAT